MAEYIDKGAILNHNLLLLGCHYAGISTAMGTGSIYRQTALS